MSGKDESETERLLREAHEARGDSAVRITAQPAGSGDYWLNGARTEVKQFDWGDRPERDRDERANAVRFKLRDAADQKARGMETGRETFEQLELDATGTNIARSDVERGTELYVRNAARDTKQPLAAQAYDVRLSRRAEDGQLSSGIVHKREDLYQRISEERRQKETADARRIREANRARTERAARLGQRGREDDRGRGR